MITSDPEDKSLGEERGGKERSTGYSSLQCLGKAAVVLELTIVEGIC